MSSAVFTTSGTAVSRGSGVYQLTSNALLQSGTVSTAYTPSENALIRAGVYIGNAGSACGSNMYLTVQDLSNVLTLQHTFDFASNLSLSLYQSNTTTSNTLLASSNYPTGTLQYNSFVSTGLRLKSSNVFYLYNSNIIFSYNNSNALPVTFHGATVSWQGVTSSNLSAYVGQMQVSNASLLNMLTSGSDFEVRGCLKASNISCVPWSNTASYSSNAASFASNKGIAASNALSNYLPLTGGTLTGSALTIGTGSGATQLGISDITNAGWRLTTAGYKLGFGNENNNTAGTFTNKASLTNAGVFDASNSLSEAGTLISTKYLASNTGAAISNVAYWASNNAGSVSNAAAFASNTAVAASNTAIFASNAVTASPAAFASNTAVFASNVGVYASNNVGIASISSASAAFASNTAVAASNVAVWCSNNNSSTSAIYASNTAVFSSNTAVLNSNVAYFASNQSVVATFASNSAVAASNTSTFASNTAVWSSNNVGTSTSTYASNTAVAASNAAFSASNTAFGCLPKTGGTLSGTLTLSAGGLVLSNGTIEQLQPLSNSYSQILFGKSISGFNIGQLSFFHTGTDGSQSNFMSLAEWGQNPGAPPFAVNGYGHVGINNNPYAAFPLDVNGQANATSLSEGGTLISTKYLASNTGAAISNVASYSSNTIALGLYSNTSVACFFQSNVTVNNPISALSNLSVFKQSYLYGNTYIESNLFVVGSTTLSNVLYTVSNAYALGQCAFSNTVTTTSNVFALGGMTCCNSMTMLGATTCCNLAVSNLTVTASQLTLSSNVTFQCGGFSTFSQPVSMLSNMTVYGFSTFEGLGTLHASPVAIGAGLGSGAQAYPFTIQSNWVGNLVPMICLQNQGGSAGAAASIDFETYTGSTIPGCRIAAIDNGNFSADLVVYSKISGSSSNSLTERFRATSSNVQVTGNLSCTGQLSASSSGGTVIMGPLSNICYMGNLYSGGLDIVGPSNYIYGNQRTVKVWDQLYVSGNVNSQYVYASWSVQANVGLYCGSNTSILESSVTNMTMRGNNLTCAGSVTATAYNISSDSNLKEDIVPADTARCEEIVRNLPLRYFQWNDDFFSNCGFSDKGQLGFIAQEASNYFPKCVQPAGPSNYLTLDQSQLFAATYGTVQNMLQKIDALTSNVSTLQTQVATLMAAGSN